MSHSILVVDDSDVVRDVIRRSLQQAGYHVSEAANGNEAVRAASAAPFSLVITDILMPEKDGLETIMYLRRTTPNTRIIAMSGAGNELYLSDARGLGATAILPKPFSQQTLLDLVRSVLDTSDCAA